MLNLSLVKRQEVHAKAKHRATVTVRLRLERGGMRYEEALRRT
jgi:hypothetical protein